MSEHARERGAGRYTNGVLTVIAGALLALLAQNSVGLPGPAEAQAQRERDRREGEAAGFNPADDRKQQISELRAINDKLDRLISVVGKTPLDVNVIKMPKDSPEPAAAPPAAAVPPAHSDAGEQE